MRGGERLRRLSLGRINVIKMIVLILFLSLKEAYFIFESIRQIDKDRDQKKLQSI